MWGRNRDPKLYSFKRDGSRDSGIKEAGGDGYLAWARGEMGIPSGKEVCRCSCGWRAYDAIGSYEDGAAEYNEAGLEDMADIVEAYAEGGYMPAGEG